MERSASGRPFNIYPVNLDGSGLDQFSFDGVFDAFPLFSPDGKYVAFSGNRFNGGGRDTIVFLADWVDYLPPPRLQSYSSFPN